ncbi:DUF4124 domain-containing protein [Ramlibacter sp. MMS24-I3-19]|uniref:DUF4124 domain-containing protein n=1 Tax=Ramlibacter sp. MMS24-I3-19 TaxID=3416606 RepID=UPI003D06AF7D
MRIRARLLVSLLVAAWCCQAGAQARIYSCVDANGRRLTADRPIMECLDREQKQYGENGTVKGRLPPSYTAQERAIEDEKIHQAQAAAQREAELRRRDRVLLNRYRDEASHQRERASSLARVDDAIAAGERRAIDLAQQRKDLEQQSATTKNVAKANQLRRQLDENAENASAQQRLLAAQRDERQRIGSRFDEEFARLQVLWNAAPVPGVTPAVARPETPTPKR